MTFPRQTSHLLGYALGMVLTVSAGQAMANGRCAGSMVHEVATGGLGCAGLFAPIQLEGYAAAAGQFNMFGPVPETNAEAATQARALCHRFRQDILRTVWEIEPRDYPRFLIIQSWQAEPPAMTGHHAMFDSACRSVEAEG